MRLLKSLDGTTIDNYPYYLDELRKEHPNVSFPSVIEPESLADFGAYPVRLVNAEYDLATEKPIEVSPALINGEWVQQWSIEPLTAEEQLALKRGQCDYNAFWEGLMASSLYAAIREQSMVSLPMNTLGTEFIALLGDAKAGRPYEDAIQASMLAILQAGVFTETQISELQAVLETSYLDSVYTITPPQV